MYICIEKIGGVEFRREFTELSKEQKKMFVNLFARAGFNDEQRKLIKRRVRKFFNGTLKTKFPDNKISEVILTDEGVVRIKLIRV